MQAAPEWLVDSHSNANNRDFFDISIRHDEIFELCCRNMAASYFDQVLSKHSAADAYTRERMQDSKGESRQQQTHLQPINNKNPTILANKPKIASSQPPIGSKQVSRSCDIVVIAHRRHWPFDVDLARRGRRQGTAVLGRDDLGDGAGV
jgi:hypothetical protein